MTTNSAELKRELRDSLAGALHTAFAGRGCEFTGPNRKATYNQLADAMLRLIEPAMDALYAGLTAAQGEQSKEEAKSSCIYIGMCGCKEPCDTLDQACSAEQASEREAFEKWAGEKNADLRKDEEGDYERFSTQCAWWAWQARAALSAPERKVTDAEILKLADDFGIDYDGSFYRNPDEDKANFLEFARTLLNQQGEQP